MTENKEHLIRQWEILPPEKMTAPITVIGAGAIGSFVVLALAKMGFEDITVWDFDTVSLENMNCQWYRFEDIGKPKVVALKKIIEDFTKTSIKECPFAWTPEVLFGLQGGIVIAAVDSMKVRKQIWEAAKESSNVHWIIDPRMASEYALCYVMDPTDLDDVRSYEKTLYSDENAVQERCTAKATMYTATMIAGYVAKAVKDIVTGGKYARVTHWDIAMNNMLNWAKKEKTNDMA